MDSMTVVAMLLLGAAGAVWFVQTRKKNTIKGQLVLNQAAPVSEAEMSIFNNTVNDLVNELKALAQENISEIAACNAQLNDLLAKAEERIAKLEALQSEPVIVDETNVTKAQTVIAESSPLSLAEEARRLSAANADEATIAKKLGISRGEVRLLFALKQSQAA